MTHEALVEPEEADSGGATIDRETLVEQMGEFGAELCKRLDPAYCTKDGKIQVMSVREFRLAFKSAREPGRGKIVKPQRGGSEEELLVISLSDVAAAFQAAIAEFDWTQVFAPRRDLPAATFTLALHRGRRGRALAI